MLIGVALMAVVATLVSAQEAPEAPPPGDGPPLPYHTIEGVGGVFITPIAYSVNPGPPGTIFGRPALSTHFALIGDKDFESITMTWTLWRRLELGYGLDRLGLDDLPGDILRATGVDIGTDDILLHNLNARLNVIEEGRWDLAWMPAVTLGAHYKYNEDVKDIDRKLGGALGGIGVADNDGVDFTLTASKMLTCLPRPVILSAGARASKGAQLGFLGFTDDYSLTFEGSVVALLSDRLVVAAEYRQKPDELARIPGLIGREDDWWDACVGYIVNDHLTVAAGLGNFGTVANHSDEMVYAVCLKFEF